MENIQLISQIRAFFLLKGIEISSNEEMINIEKYCEKRCEELCFAPDGPFFTKGISIAFFCSGPYNLSKEVKKKVIEVLKIKN